MLTREQVIQALSDFKAKRDALLDAELSDFPQHLRAFVRELDRNPLCVDILTSLRPFEVDAWWKKQTGGVDNGRRRLERLEMPDVKDDQLQCRLDLIRSFDSDDRTQLSVSGFGQLFQIHKAADALEHAQKLVLRPFSEEIADRLRKSAVRADPAIRELAGVPLSRIPSEKETGIFLSHRSPDKPLVDRYFVALRELGFAPWYDKDAIAAGDALHHVLESGINESCAAVFFVTPDFRDEQWIGRELALAIQRKSDRGARFAIITLVFEGATVPESLTNYRYVNVLNDLDGFWEIVRALPVELGPPRWKSDVVEE